MQDLVILETKRYRHYTCPDPFGGALLIFNQKVLPDESDLVHETMNKHQCLHHATLMLSERLAD